MGKENSRDLIKSVIINADSDMKDMALKYLEEGDMENLSEVLALDLNTLTSRHVQMLNNQVASGLQGLAEMGRWTNLSRIARDAIQRTVLTVERDEKDSVTDIIAVKHKIILDMLDLPLDELKAIHEQLPK